MPGQGHGRSGVKSMPRALGIRRAGIKLGWDVNQSEGIIYTLMP